MRYFMFILMVVSLSACGEKPDTQADKGGVPGLKGKCTKVRTLEEIRRGEECK